MILYRVIDKATGLFIRDDFTFDEATEIGLDVSPAQGLYKPKWQDGQWAEGATQEEVDALYAPPQPTKEELIIQLQSTDYKIIKCYEYQLAGLELPYDIQALHAERQALRDMINALEG